MKTLLLASLLTLLAAPAGVAQDGKHLFILSGQSNMAGLDPDESFTPAVEKEYGKDRVLVVKDAHGGQPIRRWYRQWQAANGDAPQGRGDLYDRLMSQVKGKIEGQKIDSVTFLWMQGERDAREGHADVYAASFRGILEQLAEDLGRSDIFFVIGRLSDFDMANERYRDWTSIRDVQVELAESSARGAWVNTDDLNDGKNRQGKDIENDLHYSAAGYVEFGRRLAREAISLINLPLVFEEDFEAGLDSWEIVDEGSWALRKVDDNHVFGITRRESDYAPEVRSPLHIALIKGLELADFVITFRVMSTKDTGAHRDCCVFFNHQDPKNFYYVHLGARPDPHSGQIMVVKDAPRLAITKNENPTPWKADSWHHVKLVRDSGTGQIEVYFDDMTKPLMSVVDKTFGKGRIGIGSFDDMDDFDDLRIRGR